MSRRGARLGSEASGVVRARRKEWTGGAVDRSLVVKMGKGTWDGSEIEMIDGHLADDVGVGVGRGQCWQSGVVRRGWLRGEGVGIVRTAPCAGGERLVVEASEA